MKKGHMTVKKFKVMQILYLYQELKKIIEKATGISFYIAETQNNLQLFINLRLLF